jgi:hypothetical protein
MLLRLANQSFLLGYSIYSGYTPCFLKATSKIILTRPIANFSYIRAVLGLKALFYFFYLESMCNQAIFY